MLNGRLDLRSHEFSFAARRDIIDSLQERCSICFIFLSYTVIPRLKNDESYPIATEKYNIIVNG